MGLPERSEMLPPPIHPPRHLILLLIRQLQPGEHLGQGERPADVVIGQDVIPGKFLAGYGGKGVVVVVRTIPLRALEGDLVGDLPDLLLRHAFEVLKGVEHEHHHRHVGAAGLLRFLESLHLPLFVGVFGRQIVGVVLNGFQHAVDIGAPGAVFGFVDQLEEGVGFQVLGPMQQQLVFFRGLPVVLVFEVFFVECLRLLQLAGRGLEVAGEVDALQRLELKGAHQVVDPAFRENFLRRNLGGLFVRHGTDALLDDVVQRQELPGPYFRELAIEKFFDEQVDRGVEHLPVEAFEQGVAIAGDVLLRNAHLAELPEGGVDI
jgi:hypothetical protein